MFYERELETLQQKLGHLKQEINLTNLIIHLVTNEKTVDITTIPEKLSAIEHLSTKTEKE